MSRRGPVYVPALCAGVELSQSDCNQLSAGRIYCREWLNRQPWGARRGAGCERGKQSLCLPGGGRSQVHFGACCCWR